MYRVLKNEKISNNSYLMEVEAPLIGKRFIPGQFVIVMSYENSERIPLTIYDINGDVVSLIYQVVGASTLELNSVSDSLYAIAGPLGKPNEICSNIDDFKDKRIIYIAGGVGIAPIYPQVKWLNNNGYKIDVIYGARDNDSLLIKDKIEEVARSVTYTTDDGSYGVKGNVCDVLVKVIESYDIVIAIGPVIMMKYVSELTKKYNKKTIVSMNPLMVDGTGMCGACRCEIEGKPKFACIDGPEFDGHKVNFDLALKRLNIYKEEEKEKLEAYKGGKL